MREQKSNSSESIQNTRVKLNRKTVGITLPQNLIKQARKHKLNLSRITEQALLSILDFMEAQNIETSSEASSKFLGSASFQKKVRCRGPGLNRRPVEISPANSPFLLIVV